MIKKLIMTAAVFACMSSAPVFAAQFQDVPEGNWAEQVIEQANAAGIMQGRGSNLFGFGETVKRSEFAAMLNRLMGWEKTEAQTVSFEDVGADAWYYQDVETLAANGAVDAGGSFRPEDQITREEMAVMLIKALGYDSLAQSVGESPFADVNSSEGYITQAYDFGIINGKSDTEFDPAGSALREESAAMMMRLYDKYTHKLDYLHGFYAISSWAQRDMAAQMDDVSFGWSRLEYTIEQGVYLNTTGENGNDWKVPDGAQDAKNLFEEKNVGMNLAVMMNTSQKVTLPDQTQTDACRAVLLNENNRSKAVEALVQEAQNYGGITIDFEGMKGQELKEGLNAFIKELKENLGNKRLYIAVHPVMKNSSAYYDAYDYRTLGAYADKIILMAHDYAANQLEESLLGTGFNATPVTPFDEIYYALKAVTDSQTGVEDKEKIVLAVSLPSTAAWKTENGKIIDKTPMHPSIDTITKRLKQSDTQITYSQQYRNPYAYYKDDNGQEILLWYEDSRSIDDKIRLARMFGVNGLSIWRIGAIPSDDTPQIHYNIWNTVLSEME